jgi:hypothetical protein
MMRKADPGIRRLTSRYGHRAVFIWLFAGIYLFSGVSTFLSSPPVVPDLFHTSIPTAARALIWVVSAAVAIAVSRSKTIQWLGFLALAIAVSLPLSSLLVSVVLNIVEYSPLLWQRISATLIYLVWIGVIWLVSAWADEVDMEELSARIAVPEQMLVTGQMLQSSDPEPVPEKPTEGDK